MLEEGGSKGDGERREGGKEGRKGLWVLGQESDGEPGFRGSVGHGTVTLNAADWCSVPGSITHKLRDFEQVTSLSEGRHFGIGSGPQREPKQM